MNKNDFLYLFHFPNSAWGLRYRASKLPAKAPYTKLLEILAILLDEKKIKTSDAKFTIKLARAGMWEEVIYLLHAVYSVEEMEKLFELK